MKSEPTITLFLQPPVAIILGGTKNVTKFQLKVPNGSILPGASLLQSGQKIMVTGVARGIPAEQIRQQQLAIAQYQQQLLRSNQPSASNFNSLLHNGVSKPTPTIITPEEDAVDDEEDIYQAETYADYMPEKLKLGNHHPDPVVETSSLSSVTAPDVWYRFLIPEEIIDASKLSALQCEAIVYACQQHDTFLPDGTRAGFLLGDGAGVGKGRTLAGIIYENFLLDRKRAIWLSVSNDLRYDAERDLHDIGAKKINVYPLNKVSLI